MLLSMEELQKEGLSGKALKRIKEDGLKVVKENNEYIVKGFVDIVFTSIESLNKTLEK